MLGAAGSSFPGSPEFLSSALCAVGDCDIGLSAIFDVLTNPPKPHHTNSVFALGAKYICGGGEGPKCGAQNVMKMPLCALPRCRLRRAKQVVCVLGRDGQFGPPGPLLDVQIVLL